MQQGSLFIWRRCRSIRPSDTPEVVLNSLKIGLDPKCGSCGMDKRLSRHWRLCVLVLAPLLLSLIPALTGNSEQSRCALLMLTMASYWLMEVLPLSLTAILPFLLAPLLSIGSAKELARMYFTDIHFLVIGGIILSTAMESTRLNRRFALFIVLTVGAKPRWLLLGFMLPGWLLSMWMSNTGSTILMYPFVAAAIDEFERARGFSGNSSNDAEAEEGALNTSEFDKDEEEVEEEEEEEEENKAKGGSVHGSMSVCYCLSIAYACNVGGVATLIGTGTNLILVGQLSQIYGVDGVITFSNWMFFCVPLSIASVFVLWIALQVIFLGPRETFLNCGNDSAEEKEKQLRVREYFRQQLKNLGPMSFGEWATLMTFPLALLLLLTGKLTESIGWHRLFGENTVTDSTGMLLAGLPLLLLPGGKAEDGDRLGYRPIIRWKQVIKNMPFDILLLIGGGLALAHLTRETRLSETVGLSLLPTLRALPIYLTVLLICFCVIWLTEVTSNMATASVLLPIVAQVAACLNKNPLLFMLPLTVTCSFAFCLPTATPPNAIVFSQGRVTIPQMARAGVLLNVFFTIVITFYCLSVGQLVFGVNDMPDWASSSSGGCNSNGTAGLA